MGAALATASFPALGTNATVCVREPGSLALARRLVEREVAAIDEACSRFRNDSELVALNTAGGRLVRVSDLLLEAVVVALQAAEATGGLVDPTVGRALRAAGYDRDFSLMRIRAADALAPAFETVPGWQAVTVDLDACSVRLHAGVELDLGATAKAFAADRAASAAATETGCGVLVSLGGDIAVAGAAPAGGWPVLVTDDHAARLDAPGQTVSVLTGGLATSSTTVRRWRTTAGEMHHIIDPRTGWPALTPWKTVTVAAASGVDANVASTASLILGSGAPAWLEARRLPARLVAAGGTVVTVAGWPSEAP